MWRLSLLAAAVFVTACGRIGYESSDPQTSRSNAASAGGATSSGGASSADGGVDSGSAGVAGQGGGGAGSAGVGGSSGGVDAGVGGAGGAGGTDASSAGGADGASSGGAGGQADSGGAGGAYTCSPTATEICDGRDNNCDTQVDEGAACPSKCTGHTWGGRGYMFCDDQNWWNSWDPVCVQNGMLLARIESQPENDFAAGLASTQLRGMWIDGTDVAVEGEWSYLDGTPFWSGGPAPAGGPVGGAYTNWATTEPDDIHAGGGTGSPCNHMFPNGTWGDEACNVFMAILCEAP